MVQNRKENTDARSPAEKPETSGRYTRLNFLDTQLLRILILAVVLIAGVYLMIPRQEKLADFYIRKGMHREALSVLSEMITEHPGRTDWLLQAARQYEQVGEKENAARMRERVIEQEPDDTDTLRWLARYYTESGQPERAVPLWEALLDTFPEDRGILRHLARFYAEQGNYSKATGMVRQLIAQEAGLAVSERFPFVADEQAAERLGNDLLLRALDGELAGRAGGGEDRPGEDALLVRLYHFRESHARRLAELHPDLEAAPLRSFELMLEAGTAADARAFARRLDELAGGVTHRLALVNLLRWRGREEAADDLLAEMRAADPENVALLLQMAAIAREQEKPEKAIPLLEEIVRLSPDEPAHQESLAALYLEVERPGDAYRIYRTLCSSGGDDRNACLERMLTTAGYTGEPEILVEAADSAVSATEDPALLRQAATLYLWAGRPGRAYPVFRRLVAMTSQSSEELLAHLIDAARLSGKNVLIREAAGIAVGKRPDDLTLRLKVADMLLRSGFGKAAIPHYTAYVRRNPGDVQILKRLAQLYLWENNPRGAYDIYRALAGGKGGDAATIRRMIEIADLTGDPEVRLEAARLGKRLLPGDTDLQKRTAKVMEETGNASEAIASLQTYIRQNPDDAVARRRLADLYRWNGKAEAASRLLGEISDQIPGDFDSAVAAGDAYAAAGQVGKGIGYMERASAIRPEDAELLRKLATWYGWEGRTEQMITALAGLEKRGTLKKEERILLAQSYLDREEGPKALTVLRPLEEEPPLAPKEGLMLGRAYQLTGKPDAAVRIYRRLAADHSDDPALLADIGDHALWLQYIDLAGRFYEAALRIDPKNLKALKGSAQIYAWNNNPRRAIERFEAYNRLNPNDYSARYQLGELYFAGGRKGDAFREYRKARELINRVRTVKGMSAD